MELGPEEGPEPVTSGLLDEAELRASVRREVAHVLSTRCALSLSREGSLEPGERSALDYGLPDVGTLNLESPTGARILEGLIARAVQAFEPRLELLQVTVQPSTADRAFPLAVLTARWARALSSETLSLPLRLDRGGRLVEVGDEE